MTENHIKSKLCFHFQTYKMKKLRLDDLFISFISSKSCIFKSLPSLGKGRKERRNIFEVSTLCHVVCRYLILNLHKKLCTKGISVPSAQKKEGGAQDHEACSQWVWSSNLLSEHRAYKFFSTLKPDRLSNNVCLANAICFRDGYLPCFSRRHLQLYWVWETCRPSWGLTSLPAEG